MKTVTLSSKYQIVLPSAVRAKLGLQSGDKLIVGRVSNNEVVLKKEPSYHDLIGMLEAQPPDPVQRVRHSRDAWN